MPLVSTASFLMHIVGASSAVQAPAKTKGMRDRTQRSVVIFTIGAWPEIAHMATAILPPPVVSACNPATAASASAAVAAAASVPSLPLVSIGTHAASIFAKLCQQL